jgi:hypothetical protein
MSFAISMTFFLVYFSHSSFAFNLFEPSIECTVIKVNAVRLRLPSLASCIFGGLTKQVMI